jgi:hypothetical protein
MRADLHTSCTEACALPLARDSSPHTRLWLLCVMTRLVLVAQVHDLGGSLHHAHTKSHMHPSTHTHTGHTYVARHTLTACIPLIVPPQRPCTQQRALSQAVQPCGARVQPRTHVG